MIVLDTTVLAYAVGGEHPLRDAAGAIVTRIAASSARVTTTIEAVQEFAHVRARRTSRQEAARVAAEFANLLAPLLVVGDDDLRAGLTLFAGSDRLGAFDAVLAAAARARGATLVSADRAFAGVPDLDVILLDAADAARLVP